MKLGKTKLIWVYCKLPLPGQFSTVLYNEPVPPWNPHICKGARTLQSESSNTAALPHVTQLTVEETNPATGRCSRWAGQLSNHRATWMLPLRRDNIGTVRAQPDLRGFSPTVPATSSVDPPVRLHRDGKNTRNKRHYSHSYLITIVDTY